MITVSMATMTERTMTGVLIHEAGVLSGVSGATGGAGGMFVPSVMGSPLRRADVPNHESVGGLRQVQGHIAGPVISLLPAT